MEVKEVGRVLFVNVGFGVGDFVEVGYSEFVGVFTLFFVYEVVNGQDNFQYLRQTFVADQFSGGQQDGWERRDRLEFYTDRVRVVGFFVFQNDVIIRFRIGFVKCFQFLGVEIVFVILRLFYIRYFLREVEKFIKN